MSLEREFLCVLCFVRVLSYMYIIMGMDSVVNEFVFVCMNLILIFGSRDTKGENYIIGHWTDEAFNVF